jgi:molybdate transport system regulatory protein
MMNEQNRKLVVKGRIWIDAGGDSFLGSGKVNLLRKTAELGSLRKAAIELNMSYRQAWYSLNQANKAAGTPLIVLQRGGKQGGTAVITPFGSRVMEQFIRLESEFQDFLSRQTELLKL